jgi:hypothetical protein
MGNAPTYILQSIEDFSADNLCQPKEQWPSNEIIEMSDPTTNQWRQKKRDPALQNTGKKAEELIEHKQLSHSM